MDHSHHTSSPMVEGESSFREYLKLAAILAVITLGAWSLTPGQWDWSAFLGAFMGLFFVIFASFKFIGYEMFTVMFAGYDILAKRFKGWAAAYPFVEFFLGLLYLADAIPTLRDLLTLAIMAVGTVGVIQELRRRSGIHCACLGNIIKLPLSTVSLVEDAGMGLMALAMLFL